MFLDLVSLNRNDARKKRGKKRGRKISFLPRFFKDGSLFFVMRWLFLWFPGPPYNVGLKNLISKCWFGLSREQSTNIVWGSGESSWKKLNKKKDLNCRPLYTEILMQSRHVFFSWKKQCMYFIYFNKFENASPMWNSSFSSSMSTEHKHMFINCKKTVIRLHHNLEARFFCINVFFDKYVHFVFAHDHAWTSDWTSATQTQIRCENDHFRGPCQQYTNTYS